MLVDKYRKFVFVHVPRTGGHSGYSMLGRKRDKNPTHSARLEVGFPGYWSFGFIRNPWARMVSCYLHQKEIEIPAAEYGFPNYLENIWGHNVGKSAMTLLAGCDFIGRFERFEDDWLEVFHNLGMAPPKIFPKLNTALSSGGYRNYYSGHTAQLVAYRYKEDIEFGSYVF